MTNCLQLQDEDVGSTRDEHQEREKEHSKVYSIKLLLGIRITLRVRGISNGMALNSFSNRAVRIPHMRRRVSILKSQYAPVLAQRKDVVSWPTYGSVCKSTLCVISLKVA